MSNSYTKFSFRKLLAPGITSMVLLCSVVMTYGWGWRGSYGHEVGAMIPGALMAMAAALTSGREDWHRRSLIIGMFGAVGWAFGGSMSYMEHNFYITSDSFLDVAYGYFGFGFIAFLWTGVGAAILALAFTKKISELEKYSQVAIAIAIFWFFEYIWYLIFPEHYKALDKFTQTYFHDGEWFAALTTLMVSSAYWILKPTDRKQAALFIQCALGWWAGYLILTKFGGILLAPPDRSESWGGNLGILIVLLYNHYKEKNRVALMFTNYAMLIGPIAYITAVFIHLPFRINWLGIPSFGGWKLAEELFGMFMGLGMGLAFAKVIKGGVVAIPDDGNKKRLDIISVIMLVILMMWLNLRKNVVDWGNRYHILPEGTFRGLYAWQWFLLTGLFCVAIVLYCIYLYQKGKLTILPQGALEKGIIVFLLVIFISLFGISSQRINDWKGASNLEYVSYFYYAFLSMLIILILAGKKSDSEKPPMPVQPAEDKNWNPGWKFWMSWTIVPVIILIFTILTTTIDDGSYYRARKRFGPDAYWKLKQKEPIEQTK